MPCSPLGMNSCGVLKLSPKRIVRRYPSRPMSCLQAASASNLSSSWPRSSATGTSAPGARRSSSSLSSWSMSLKSTRRCRPKPQHLPNAFPRTRSRSRARLLSPMRAPDYISPRAAALRQSVPASTVKARGYDRGPRVRKPGLLWSGLDPAHTVTRRLLGIEWKIRGEFRPMGIHDCSTHIAFHPDIATTCPSDTRP